MLGFITHDGRGGADRLLNKIASQLEAKGQHLAGAVQENLGGGEVTRCDMVLRVLGTDQRFTISQRLGSGAVGCRLEPDAFERAVGLVETTLSDDTVLLIVNKYGKQEIEGRGFRMVIAEALSRGIPVLTSTGRSHRPAFLDFADSFAEEITPTPDAILDWLARQDNPAEAT